ncbi:MAG TPA: carboxypeptidase-like regulatory domain-containing protein, partial [Planctomycetota bacterium]|nr:carboxypeptidase-like regulatory domain-containing protein [Planctomycetota bacterium]
PRPRRRIGPYARGAMRHLLVALAVVGLLGLLWLSVPRRDAADASGPGATPVAERESTATALASGEPEVTAREAPPSGTREAVDVAVEAGGVSAAPPPGNAPAGAPGLVRITGLLLAADDGPAVGATLRVHGARANSERAALHGLPEDWVDPEGVADAEGRFALEFDPPPAYQFFLEASLPGYATAGWRWGGLARGQIVDLGVVRLPRGGTLTGRISNSVGAPLGGWGVMAESSWLAAGARESGGHGTPEYHYAATDADGRFRIEDVAPGRIAVHGEYRDLASTAPATVALEEGGQAFVELVHEGGDPAARVELSLYLKLFDYDFPLEDLDPGGFVLEGPEGTLDLAQPGPDGERGTASGLAPGSYSVVVSDPRFVPRRLDDFALGRAGRIRVDGSSAVRLSVADAAYGLPVPAVRVRGRIARYGDLATLHELGPLPPDGVLGGFVAGPTTILVDAPGFAAATVELADLAPREVRDVAVLLTRPVAVRGVVRVAGVPAGGIALSLATHEPELEQRGHSAPLLAQVESGPDGVFAFEDIGPGTFVVFAVGGPGRTARSGPLQVAGVDVVGLQLELPAAGSILGRVLVPGGLDLAAWSLVATYRPREISEVPRGLPHEAHVRTVTSAIDAATGRFEFSGLGAGRYTFELDSSAQPPPGDRAFFRSGVALGEQVALEAGDRREVEFDLRESFPGRADVRATIDGRPSAGAGLVLAHDSGRHRTFAALDGTGAAVVERLLPGRWWIGLSESSEDDTRWSVPLGIAIDVPVHGVGRGEGGVALAPGAVRVVTPTGEPAAGLQFWVEPAPEWDLHGVGGGGESVLTDGAGRVALELPVGVYVLRPVGLGGIRFDAARLPRLPWPPAGEELEVAVPE